MNYNLYLIGVVLTLVVSGARITRLLTFDNFPPVQWLREELQEWTDKTPTRLKWQPLTYCPWCLSFWVTLAILLWADVAGVFARPPVSTDFSNCIWWVVNGVLALSYLSAMLMVRDDPSDNENEESA